MAHVSQAKKDSVVEFKKLVAEYPIVGIVNVQNLPTAQLNTMRGSLRGDSVVIKMTKKRVLKIILQEMESTKPGITKLVDHLGGMPAVIFAKDGAFKLYKKIQSKKSAAPAKAGSIAPRDLIVPAGATPFAPGPIISELAQYKIKAGIENGKVAIKVDSTVARTGDVISGGLASVLTRLNIYPMEIGLDVVAMFEKGTVYTREILSVDEKQYIAQLVSAHQQAFGLAIETSIINKDTTEYLLGKAANQARTLAIECVIMEEEVVADILARAETQANSIKQLTN
jgi:large subunit ribosomal protein L10